jgi:hypothetical protein
MAHYRPEGGHRHAEIEYDRGDFPTSDEMWENAQKKWPIACKFCRKPLAISYTEPTAEVICEDCDRIIYVEPKPISMRRGDF